MRGIRVDAVVFRHPSLTGKRGGGGLNAPGPGANSRANNRSETSARQTQIRDEALRMSTNDFNLRATGRTMGQVKHLKLDFQQHAP